MDKNIKTPAGWCKRFPEGIAGPYATEREAQESYDISKIVKTQENNVSEGTKSKSKKGIDNVNDAGITTIVEGVQ